MANPHSYLQQKNYLERVSYIQAGYARCNEDRWIRQRAIKNSTLLLRKRPFSVLLSPTGLSEPFPSKTFRLFAESWAGKNERLRLFARFSVRSRLYSATPRLSVYTNTFIFNLLFCKKYIRAK